ncbi:hypothetical protein C6558_03435 [Ensifer sp. NM-2]|uniref:hypothetical protein n=1 Tax=Ensifer sp. NM-2 TaxID=2109730 RepID=UPI000D139584|nr:hypothetical protein [Ensifer sp. NM-2]PSS67077.1 hypothetical protein C6558_03435 [Ensifer sp. NM-2]
MAARLRPGEPGHDPDWDSPEAIAKWRVRGIYNIHERAKAFHRIKQEIEAEDQAVSKSGAAD